MLGTISSIFDVLLSMRCGESMQIREKFRDGMVSATNRKTCKFLASKFVTDIYESNGKFHAGAALVEGEGGARGEKFAFCQVTNRNCNNRKQGTSQYE